MDLIVKSILEGKVNSVISGVSSVTVDGTTLNFEFTDGNTASMDFPTPADGVSVTGATVDSNNHLIVELSNNTTVDAGLVPTGKGEDGYSPIIGKDYWTSADKTEIETYCKNYIDESLLGGEF